MAKKSKDELQRLELEEQIQDAIKRSTASLENFAEAQKKIAENYKIIQKINLQIQASEEEIDELRAKGLDEKSEEIRLIRQRQAALKQDIGLIVTINKELSKGKNLAKTVGNEFIGWSKELKRNFIPSLTEIFSKFLDIDNLAHQTANTIGFQGAKFKLMEGNINAVQKSYVDMGFSLEDAYKTQSALSEETGRQVMLSQGAAEALTQTARIVGLMPDEMGTLVGQMEAFGLGAEQSSDMILNMSKEASDMGINSAKVIKSFQQNLGLLNKLNFKNGVKGLQEMAKFSVKYKLDMQSVASVADKVFRPEGAIEAAAQLQVLGGSLASLGDPFQLMYKARNAPEELGKSLTKAATASATWDKTTKLWKVNAYELDRLKEAAQALGMDYSQLVETAKQGAKIKQFEGILGGKPMDKDTKEALIGAAQMGKNGAFITITDPDGKAREVLLKDVTKEQADLFKKQTDDRAELSEKAKSLTNQIDEIKNTFLLAGVQIFNELKPLIKDLLHFGKWLIDTINPKVLMGAIVAIPFAWWYVKGQILGSGFNSVTMGKNGLGGIGKGGSPTGGSPMGGGSKFTETFTNSKGRLMGKGTGADGKTISGFITKEQATEIEKSNNTVSDSTTNLGKASSMSAVQILALGAALLMVGAAIWLAADGISHLVMAFKGLTGPESLAALGSVIAIMVGFAFMIDVVAAAALPAALPLLALGVAFLMIGGGIAIAALGLSVLVGSFTKMFSVIGDNGSSLILAGIGFMSMAAGIGALSISLIALGAASLLALPGLLILGGVTSMLTETASALASTGGSEGITKTISAINSVDTGKLEALKELSVWMSLLGATTTIKFDESLHVDGSIEINGQAGGKKDTDWISDPIFISKLKEFVADATKKDKNGGYI